MITTEEARALRSVGLGWRPRSGDAFTITRTELEGEVFTVSEMTIEPHEFDTGTILGFNGTTEWALDSVAIEDALWLPREDQLRELLGNSFRSLRHAPGSDSAAGRYTVVVDRTGAEQDFTADTAASAYALALLALIAEPRASESPSASDTSSQRNGGDIT